MLNELSHIIGDEDLMAQTIKFLRSIRRKAKAKEAGWEYVPNAETRMNFKKYLNTLDLQALCQPNTFLIL